MTHGDFHMGNVAFTSHNSAVTFFDLQVSRQNSGVTDLVQYLVQVGGYAAQCRVRDMVLQVTTASQRETTLPEFIDCYCKVSERCYYLKA